MQIKIIDFNFRDEKSFTEAMKIRNTVFVKEQNVPEELEYDGLDEEAKHFLLYFNDKPIATSRLRTTDQGYKLERFAVLEEYRRKHFGNKLLDYIVKSVKDPKKIYFNSQITAVKFYESNGFFCVGKAFYEAGIKHYKMVYKE